MKQRLGILGQARTLLLCVLCATTVEAQGFRALDTQDGVNVWAVGDAGTVFRSLDGGDTWGSYPLGSANHRGVAAWGDHVWIVDDTGFLWTSSDGGDSFQPSMPAGSVALYAIDFADAQTGWIVGASGRILKTSDTGATWIDQNSGVLNDLLAVRFRSAFDGWACGANGNALRTSDGGVTWNAVQPLGFAGDLFDVDFDGNTVYVAGSEAFAARSDDAGNSWSALDLEIASRSDVNGLVLQPGGALWLCGGGGFLRSTPNAGSTWSFAKHSIVTGMNDVFFSDAMNGWACAARSKLVARTTDGGATWSVPGGGAFALSWNSPRISNEGRIVRGNTLRIDPFNRRKLYAVQGTQVYASWDLGDTWHGIATITGGGSRTNAFLVSPTDTLTWLALIQDVDRVTRTTDGGATWTSVIAIPYTEYGLPLEQDPNDPQVVYFGPEDGKIWKSIDFGATWLAVCDSMFRSPDDIAVVPDTTGVIYVADGVTGIGSAVIWKSSDGGATWSNRKTLPGSEIPMLAVSHHDRNIGYATTWPFGGVERTTDMGETWTTVRTTPSEWGADIAKDDPNVAITAVYSGAMAYVTVDGGDSWVASGVLGSNYGALAYDRGTFFVHQSGGIWKASVSQPDMPVLNAETIVMVHPSGGEVFQYADLESILWDAQNIENVEIEFQKDPWTPWETLVAAMPAEAGAWDWTIPNAPSNQARLRIGDAIDGDPVDGTVTPFTIVVPELVASRTSLDFGEVAVGASAMDTIRIVNDGTATLVVTSVTVASGGPFTPTRTSFSIPPGSSDTLALVFEPSAVEAYADTVVIACNAPQNPVRIPMAGSGFSGVAVAGTPAPDRFDLRPNVPNPFGAGGTVVAYALPRAAEVRLAIYNVLGQEVATLVDRHQEAGAYAVRFPNAVQRSSGFAGAIPSGVYFCRLEAGGFRATRRMVMIR